MNPNDGSDDDGQVPRLNMSLLARLAGPIEVPNYDRGAMPIGIGHIGAGAFHRCHQDDFTEEALRRGLYDRAVVAVNLRPPRLGPLLRPQDGLYTRTLRDERGAQTRVIGCIRDVFDAETEFDAAIGALAAQRVGTVTLTVTEKAYCHRPATGELDETNPDLVADLTDGEQPRSLPVFLVRMLARRAATNGAPINLISCDNIPANGRLLRNVVRRAAELAVPDLCGWIDDHVAFPSTMVDRIVPATAPLDLDNLAARLGVRDEAAVFGEPFGQWVIEEQLAAPLPPWHEVGAELVRDVEGHEQIKMRILNAAQTAAALLGLLLGHELTSDAIRDPDIRAFVLSLMREETFATLPEVPGMAPDRYLQSTIERIENRAIQHRNSQIATDTSQKIVQRVLAPLTERRARGLGCERLTALVAAWIAVWAIEGEAAFQGTVGDPLSDRIVALRRASRGDPGLLADGIFDIPSVFDPSLAGDAVLRCRLREHCQIFAIGGGREHLRTLSRPAQR